MQIHVHSCLAGGVFDGEWPRWVLINRRAATCTLSERWMTVLPQIAQRVQQMTSARWTYTSGRLSLDKRWKSPFPVRRLRNSRSDVDIRHRSDDEIRTGHDLTNARDTRHTRGEEVFTTYRRTKTVRITINCIILDEIMKYQRRTARQAASGDDVTGGEHRTKTTHTRERPSYGRRQYQQQCLRRWIVIINYFGQRRSLRHRSLLPTFGGVRADCSP